jgi:hypothetical protein
MGVPASEVGYTIATTRRETTKVHKNMWWHWWGGGVLKNHIINIFYLGIEFTVIIIYHNSRKLLKFLYDYSENNYTLFKSV